MHEQAAGCLVDVFGGGHESDAEFVETAVDFDVVGAVACEAVEFVDDDVVDVAVFFDVGQHLFECWPVGGGSGYATFDEFFDDHCAHGLGFFLIGFALCRY